jgi:ABC-2 type transport system permease protein
MKKAYFIALKEVRDFLWDRGDLVFALVLPILIFALIYGAFGNNLQFNGTAYIVNQDSEGKYSALLLQDLKQYPTLSVNLITQADADSKLQHSDIDMAIIIPADFSSRLASSQPAQIVFKQRGNGGTEGQIVAGLVRGTADGIAQNLQVQSQVGQDLASSGLSSQQIESAVQQNIQKEQATPAFSVKDTPIGTTPDPVRQFLPGIMTMFVLFAVNLTAQALVDERRKGTLERLMATRLKVGELFLGKFAAYAARGFIQTLILMLLAYAVFRVFTPLSFLQYMVVAFLFSAACSTLGLIIGSIARSQNQATWIAVFFTMLMVMLSGTFVAIPDQGALHTLSYFSINTYANDAFRELIGSGGSLAGARNQVLVMLGVAVVGLVISRMVFRVSQQGGK